MSTGLQDRVSWFQQVAELRVPVVKIISAIEELPGHWQILAAGLTFFVLCRGGGLDPHEILQRITRMEKDADAPFAKTFKAMKEYAANELND